MTRISTLCVFLTILIVAPFAQGQAYSVLYNFGSKSGDPLQPSFSGIVAQGRDGNLYSTSPSGGTGNGTAFKITPAGTMTVLHNFNGTSDGGSPVGGLTLGKDGNFYGTAMTGGTCCGTIFKITPKGKLTVLHTFGNDGASPTAPPIQGSDGMFYGTTVGGIPGAPFGTVYKISSSGKFKMLHIFADESLGGYPYAPLVQGTDGNFYGTTTVGGTNSGGTAFKITSAGKITVLFNFDIAHGVTLVGPLIQGGDGNFYGTTYGGGASNVGTIFQMTPAGGVTVLHSFNFSPDGARPNAGLVQGTDGTLFGAADEGGTLGFGTLYKVTSGSTYSVLYTFDGTTGEYPNVTPMQHTNGALYGDALKGGTGANGVFYSLGEGLSSFVALVTPAAKVGVTVGILGQGFTGTTAVSFNGTAAIFKVVNSTYMTAVVPTGATTGPLRVTTPSGVLASNKSFQVLP